MQKSRNTKGRTSIPMCFTPLAPAFCARNGLRPVIEIDIHGGRLATMTRDGSITYTGPTEREETDGSQPGNQQGIQLETIATCGRSHSRKTPYLRQVP